MPHATVLSDKVGLSQSQLVIKIIGLVLAGLVAFIVVHLIFDLFRYLAFRFRFRESFIPRSWPVVLIISLWTMLTPTRSFAMGIGPSESVVQVENHPESRTFGSINSLLTCSVVVSGLLIEIGKVRGRQLCKLEINSRLSHPSATAMLTEISLHAVTQSQPEPDTALYLAANSDQPVFVPMGKSNSQLAHIDLGQNSVVNIVGDNRETSEAVFKALMMSTLFAASSKSQTIFYSSTLNADSCFSGVSVASSFAEVLQSARNAKTRSILFSREILSDHEFIQLGEYEISLVCLHSTPNSTTCLRVENSQWYMSPHNIPISPFGLSIAQISSLSELFTDTARCAEQVSLSAHPTFETVGDWKVLVRTLGPVDVQLSDGTIIKFEKSKTKELLAWLTNHRSRPTRSAARTALWEFNVADATFTNVISDIRRTLNQTHLLEPFEEWIPRTFSDQLPFHVSIVSDGELLQACINRAKNLQPAAAVADLHRGLELVRDLPFAGTGYLWPDAEGITSQLVLTVITAACMAAELDLRRGETDGVFWATAQGLKVLGAHEELFALRMRAHGLRGDLAGVRFEFESYKRAMLSDSLQIIEPSKKLVALCRELTAPNSVALAR
ncbi:MAG: bacterial transcriptional activator domain-containing protein [Actinomycetota bacterium]|nr:bacterial transcriptional activator domain-containing protein [Actinomycetota bacterium]